MQQPPMGPPNPYQPPQQGYAPQQPMPYGGGGYGEFEFNDEHNRIISGAALWARILGIAMIVIGAISLLNCNIIEFILNLVVGIFLIGGGSSLAHVVKTQGSDITHMMQAISKLGTAFKIRVIATIVALVLILVIFGLAMLLILGAAAASSR